MRYPIYYDKEGKPIGDVMEWAKRIEDPEGRHVGDKRMWFGFVRVSTVWLGLDHDFSWGITRGDLDEPNPHPIIFETMVFLRGRSGEMWRYSTIEEAEIGHKRVVKLMLNPINVIKMWREYNRDDDAPSFWKIIQRPQYIVGTAVGMYFGFIAAIVIQKPIVTFFTSMVATSIAIILVGKLKGKNRD